METIDLVDHFKDGEGNSYIITQKPKLNLAQFLAEKKEHQSGIGVKSVATWIQMIAKILKKLAAMRIAHRNICMENILVKNGHSRKNDNRASQEKQKKLRFRIAGFDLAMCFDRDAYQVRQSFNIPGVQFAPEIMAGTEHDYAVDVWGLGQVALKLLAFVSCYQGHPLRVLVAKMTKEVPDERPSID